MILQLPQVGETWKRATDGGSGFFRTITEILPDRINWKNEFGVDMHSSNDINPFIRAVLTMGWRKVS